MNEKHREKMRKLMTGKNNPRWNGGNSEYLNHAELKRMRVKVLERAKGKCEICGKPAKIIHHINGDKSNHSINNLIALCNDCHVPLHREDSFIPNLGRPLKYSLICGMSIKKISKIFGVCPGTIYGWLKDLEKSKWLKKQLKEIKT